MNRNEITSQTEIGDQLPIRQAVLGSIATEGTVFILAGIATIAAKTPDFASGIIVAEGMTLHLLHKGLKIDESNTDRATYDLGHADERVDAAILNAINRIPSKNARRATTWVARNFAAIGKARELREQSAQPDQTS